MAIPTWIREHWLLRATGLFHRAFGGYYPQMGVIVICAILGGIFEAIGISAIVPIFSFIGGGGGVAADFITQMIQSLFEFLHIPYKFRYLLMFVAVLFLARTAVLFIVQYVTVRIVHGYERSMRERLFGALVHAEWSYLSKQKVGAVSHVVIQNTTNTAQFFNYLSLVVVIGIKSVAYTFVAINVSPVMALLTLGVGAVAFFALRPIYAYSRGFAQKNEKAVQNVAHYLNQHIGGIKTIKALAVGDSVIKESQDHFERVRHSTVSILTLRGVISGSMNLVALAFIGAAFSIAYKLPGFSMPTFIVAIFAVNQIFSQMQLIQTQMHTMIAMYPYLSSLLKLVDEAEAQREVSPKTKSDLKLGDVEFKNVSFSYSGRDSGMVSDVSFTVQKGSRVGLIGPSGAGKTTIADLLLRLYAPSEGKITVDGRDVQEFPLTAWRDRVGYVTQDMFLLHDTVAKNIAFYNDELTRDEIVAAAKTANIHDFIDSLPKGYDTVIGERGVLLSGGQRQRVALARCLARKPSLLILDEATSALDVESEQAVQEAIEKLHGSTTVVVIAHRLSTVLSADSIVVLKDGVVVEQGTPKKLADDPESYYSKVLQVQTGDA